MQFEFTPNTIEKVSSDVAIVFAFANEKKDKKATFIPLASFVGLDKILDGQLTKAAKLEQFRAQKNEILKVIPEKNILSTRIFVVGLGSQKEFTTASFREIMGGFAKQMRTKTDSVSLVLPTKEEGGIEASSLVHLLVEGAMLGSYVFLKYKKEEKQEKDLATIIIANQKQTPQLKAAIERATAYSDATIIARDLDNETPTIATPTYLAKFAQDIAKSSPQITCKVYDKNEVEKMGMGAFLGIARGSETPPKFIHLEYTPKKKTKEKIALVGKGITYDSGGVSLKPPQYLLDMKMDMAGAAAVLGLFSVLTKLQPDVAVMGVISATSNMISGDALVPGDVVRAMNGKTIEIINTDAEGRVTLADSLSYAVKEGATQIVDLATLTGAIVVALGEDIAALYANDKALADSVKKAAEAEGEKLWEMPLEKKYKELNKSSVADIANADLTRYAGSITAALFLEEFVDGKPWVHLDIAGPAMASKDSNLWPKGGTGFGVRTMLKLLGI